MEEPMSPCLGSWVSMAMRVRHQWPHRNILYRDLKQIFTSKDPHHVTDQSLKELSVQVVLSRDNLAWHLACTCPTGMFDFVMEALVKELANRYRANSGQRLQYNLTRAIVRLSLHCIHSSLPLLHFLRNIDNLFDTSWFRWSSCRYHPADDVAAMWAFYAELADAMAVGYVVPRSVGYVLPRLYERSLPSLPHLDLSGIPRLRDSTWSLKTIYNAGNKELNPLLGDNHTLQLTLDLEVEGADERQLRLLHKLAADRRKGAAVADRGSFLVGVKHVYVTSLPPDSWGSLVEDIMAFPELCHVTLNMCSLTGEVWDSLLPLAPLLTGLALPNNPDLSDLSHLTAFTALDVLDLSNVDLRGLMGAITELPTCLSYLGLCGCRLTADEVLALTHSQHCPSLLQLDISENSCRGRPDLQAAYCLLFRRLNMVEVLNMSHCHLPDQDADGTATLTKALQGLSTLRLITISSKDLTASPTFQSALEALPCKIYYTV
ncbi:hypothetical protein FHG87_015826 [Trinorchestia longiramus]|nr:hypothetical protein FHG87_015826 [Trinorchestia longiramus]